MAKATRRTAAPAAAPNPFAVATRKVPASAGKTAANFIPPKDITTYDGAAYTAAEVADAINNYCEGAKKFDEGDAMKKATRPILLAIGRTVFSQQWLMDGTRPSSPTLSTSPNGKGTMIKFVPTDSVAKLDDNSFATLAGLIGATKAEACVTKRDDFVFNPELLDEVVDVNVLQADGSFRVEKQRVMDAIAAALQKTFAPSPDILGGLFKVVPVFQTNKGLIDQGLALVAPDKTEASKIRLAQFMDVGKFVTQLKPGNLG